MPSGRPVWTDTRRCPWNRASAWVWNLYWTLEDRLARAGVVVQFRTSTGRPRPRGALLPADPAPALSASPRGTGPSPLVMLFDEADGLVGEAMARAVFNDVTWTLRTRSVWR